MITPVWIVGFSGHRTLSQPEALRIALTNTFQSLQATAHAQGGTLEFYGSAAFGADTLAAETAQALNIPVHVILPMPEAEFKQDFHDSDKTFRESDWQRSAALIANARAGTHGGTLRLARGTHLRPECYYDAGMQVLDACDVLLAIWDEQPARGLGGTADIVEQARACHKPVILLSAESGSQKTERLETFVSPSDPQVQLIQKLNDQTARHRQLGITPTEAIFRTLDATANDTSKTFRSSLLRSIKFHGWATVIAAFAVILPKAEPWSNWTLFGLCALEMLLVTWALFLSRIHKWRHTHERWLTTRFGAELVRSLRATQAFLDPLTPQIMRHAPHWRRFTLTVGLAASRETDRTKPWQQLRDDYVTERLLDQQHHFQEKQAKAAATLKRTQRIGTWATWLAPAFVFIALGYKLYHALHGHSAPEPFSLPGLGKDIVIRFMPIFVPLVAGIAAGLRSALDSTRRTHRYAELAEHLAHSAATLSAIKTESSTRRHVVATEEVLLDELIEWKLAEEQNGGH